MDVLKALEQVDACLDKIKISGDDVFQMVHARQLLKTIYNAIKAGSSADNNKEE